ncbi:SusC/RagA family TonB-linked outer membrane protein [Coprobacter secundus]|uniref:SusC/RagA family TonB-linked outer membrane protein n=1 Tax=Coprobacter secundus subsp. similis TaxID=2751153 RepID=A0A7G1HQI2_9BACT|nr:TonB-dependent receptor [Coprobacter secundus]BCI61690.1 SusC/RagA family TonB-linked outer membrane protein [Coprobacter secundus subsp. similis]CCY38159.1 susC/RagA family TonB-linked outer membrane protein [Tannerella sp. CAG:118]
MKFEKRYIVLLCMLVVASASFAQIIVKGTVKGEDDLSIPGVNVLIKGTTNATVTDLDGKFSISVPSEKSVLVFSFVGMKSQDVAVGKNRNLEIVLKENSEVLDEVVVIGYGTMKKSDLTGAVSSFRPDEKDVAKVASIDNLLQGKIAGLSVGASTEAPGAASSVTIRGANSLRGDNQPLYVIDNIPQASAGEFANSGNDGTFTIASNPLSSLNPADIESIEVLKDASATAIYGSRGANGVILITTKRGKSGKPTVTASANFTLANAARLLEMMNLKEYAIGRMVFGGKAANAVGDDWMLQITNPETGQLEWNDSYQYYIDGNDIYRKLGENSKLPGKWRLLNPIDWQKEIYSTAFSQNYSLTVNGGSDKITYFTSASYKNIEGLVQGTGLRQGDVRVNLNADLSKSVKIALSLNGSLKENDMMSGGNTTGGATGAVSNVALYSAPYVRTEEEMELETPNLADRATVWTWVDDYDDKTTEKAFRGSLDLTWQICKFLSYNLRTGGNIAIQDRDRWFNITLWDGAAQNGYLTQTDFNRSNYSVENVLQFNHKVQGIVDINAVAGLTYDDYNSLNTLVVGNNFDVYDFRSNGLHMAGNTEVKQPIQSDYQLLSFLARANLSFLDGRYLLTASIRGDGSSKFLKGNRWAYFPAATVAWRMEQEKFMKDVRWVDQLKLRAGYGETGSQSIDPYSTFASYGSSFVNTPQGATKPGQSANGSGDKLIGVVVDKLPNDALKWERTRSYNVGIDFSFFQYRLGGTIDLYSKTTNDLLIQKDLPPSTGYKSIVINQGSLRNKGVEITLNGDIVRTKNFTWKLSGNIAFNQPEILDFGLPEKEWGTGQYWKAYMGNSIGDHFGEANIFIAGRAPGLFYGYETDGIIQENDPYLQKVTNTSSINTLKPGNLKFVDQNGDGVINEKDRVILGNPNAKFNYGFQTDFTWKDLTFSMTFNGVYGNDILNTNNRYFKLPSNSSSMVYKDSFYNMWRGDNPWIGAYASNTIPSFSSVTPKVVIDEYIEDGSFLRCSDITLGYNLPSKIVSKIGFKSVGIYASVKNAFLITKYTGYDPEVNSFAFDGTRPGIDVSSYPHTRSYIFGLNVSF